MLKDWTSTLTVKLSPLPLFLGHPPNSLLPMATTTLTLSLHKIFLFKLLVLLFVVPSPISQANTSPSSSPISPNIKQEPVSVKQESVTSDSASPIKNLLEDFSQSTQSESAPTFRLDAITKLPANVCSLPLCVCYSLTCCYTAL